MSEKTSFREWMLSKFEIRELKDIATHGANAGWGGLVYYHETVALYEQYRDEIWEMLLEDTESMGHDNPYALMATFGGAKDVGDYTQHANLLVWYAAERVAREITDRGEEAEDG